MANDTRMLMMMVIISIVWAENIEYKNIESFFMQGDFDPTKTRVLHFAGNPLALSRKLHAQELDNLRDENEDLRRKVKALEQRTVGSSFAQSLPSSSQEDDGKQLQGKVALG